LKRTFTSSNTFDLKKFAAIGGISALLQLFSILALMIVRFTLGPKLESAEEFFFIQQASPLEVVLRGDFLLLFLLGGYLGTFPALYLLLKRLSPTAVFFATLFTFIPVIGFFMSESTFALLHLGNQYALAASEAARAQLAAAGQAVIASDAWNSSGAYLGGIFLQGSGVIISLVMLRSKDFSKLTAISGLLGNAIDLVQHVLHLFAPSISAPIQMFMGIFYFVWFPMLARDFFRLGKGEATG